MSPLLPEDAAFLHSTELLSAKSTPRNAFNLGGSHQKLFTSYSWVP